MNSHLNPGCPLCRRKGSRPYYKDKNRIYLECPFCGLVFVPPKFYLSREAEKKEYDLHDNDPDDPGYRRFLSRLGDPMLDRIGTGQRGLDFGCGPGPVLHRQFESHGHQVDLYDPFYAGHTDPFSTPYDFITATEVVEHLHHPGRVFGQLFDMLRKAGWLGIMTKLVLGRKAFSNWHYIRDLTHVCFYSRATFEYIAREHKTDLTFIGNDVILLQKK